MTIYDPLQIEPEILEFWRKNRTFDKLRKKLARSKKRFSFIDGPITSNNPMGVHHAWGRTYKDVFQRFWAMRGHNQRWQNGFDCQGLWIEREVEKELGFKSKQDIEKYGLLNFVEACRARAEKFSKLQTNDSKKLGQWMDWENSYHTHTDTNNEHNWMLLKEYYKRGWLYKGKDAVPWCPRCGTASSKHDIVTEGYREVTHTGLYMKFPLAGKKNEYILIFTTTPWTVPANVAAAVNENLEYIKVKQKDEFYWLAEQRKQVLLNDYKIIEKVNGKELVGLKYEMPYPNMPEQDKAQHEVVPWELATGEEGTGVVHIAPGCGPEDFVLGKKLGMPAPSPLDESGIYQEGWGWLTGERASDANKKIIEDMQKRGFIYKTEQYKHRYPHCWRCGTELVFRLEDEWYIKCSDIREPLKKENQKIKWSPEYGKVRQNAWFDAMSDWLISRKRYWGLPLPFWICTKCSALEVIGSVKELKQKAMHGIEQLKELHRPWIDNVILKCPKCKSEMRRVSDVGDAWLDAGIVPFSTIGPFMQNMKVWRTWYPADFICENMPGQYRGWFNALMWSGVTISGTAPFKSVLGYESVKDEKGREMHKSLGNVIWAEEALSKIGADPLRWRFCMQDPTVELWFGYKTADEAKRTLNVLLNMGDYIRINIDKKFRPGDPKPIRAHDAWILSRLESTKKAVTAYAEALQPLQVATALQNFLLNDLSRGYVHFVREEFDEKTLQILYKAVFDTLRMMAPLVPFITEKIYQDVFRQIEKKESVHLLDWPAANGKLIDTKLELEFAYANDVISSILALREKISRGIKWPVKSVTLVTENEELASASLKHMDMVKRLTNVFDIIISHDLKGITHKVKPDFSKIGQKFGRNSAEIAVAVSRISPESILENLRKKNKLSLEVNSQEIELQHDDFMIEEILPRGLIGGVFGAYSLYIDVEENKEMLQLGFMREFTRAVQALRKKAGLQKKDKIGLFVSAPVKSQVALEAKIKDIAEKVGAKSLDFVASKSVDARKNKSKLSVRGFEAQFGF